MKKNSFSLSVYLFLSFILDPIYLAYQFICVLKGKEDVKRLRERWAIKQIKRPPGKLVWFHAASVGEAQSLLPLTVSLIKEDPEINILITSTTRTSAQIFENIFDSQIIHQMSPYDTFSVTKRFINHWKPNLAARVESEIWPRILLELKKNRTPNFLLNARFSKKTFVKIKRHTAVAKFLFSLFDEIHVQESKTLDRLLNIGVSKKKLFLTGSLKDSRKKLDFNESIAKQFLKTAGKKNIWLAACTHTGEDKIILKAHKKIGGILLIAPRHIERGQHISNLSKSMGFNTQMRSEFPELQKHTEVYIADTMGEMGLWYSIVEVAFLGGSLVEKGGHNPVEAMQFETFVLHGPFIHNAVEKYQSLKSLGVACQIEDEDILADKLIQLQSDDLKEKFKKVNLSLETNDAALHAALKSIKLAI